MDQWCRVVRSVGSDDRLRDIGDRGSLPQLRESFIKMKSQQMDTSLIVRQGKVVTFSLNWGSELMIDRSKVKLMHFF